MILEDINLEEWERYLETKRDPIRKKLVKSINRVKKYKNYRHTIYTYEPYLDYKDYEAITLPEIRIPIRGQVIA